MLKIEKEKRDYARVCKYLISLGINPKKDALSSAFIEKKYNFVIETFSRDINDDSISEFAKKDAEIGIKLLRCFDGNELNAIELKFKAEDFLVSSVLGNFTPIMVSYIKNMQNLNISPRDKPSLREIKSTVEYNLTKYPQVSEISVNIWTYSKSAEIFFQAYEDIIELLHTVYKHNNPEINRTSGKEGCYMPPQSMVPMTVPKFGC